MAGKWGQAVYGIYRAAGRAISPFLYIHWRRLRGLEHQSRWPERFGRPTAPRPPGPLIWFHAVSLGEGLAIIPVIKHCLLENPSLLVLMTTTTVSAFEVIKNRLPNSVIYQFAPVDTPMAMENFLVYWNPIAVILMESEVWPNLIISASRKGIEVALLNARMSCNSFKRWSLKISRPLISLLLSKFSLIVALNTAQAVRYQLLNAPPFIINFAVGGLQLSQSENKSIEGLKLQLNDRPVWMAASIHKSEAEVMISVHKELAMAFPNLITIIVMRHPQHGKQLAQALQKRGMLVALRSKSEMVSPCIHVYVVDTLGELGMLFRVTPIAVIGGSFQSGLSGHNFSEAAAAGCAVLTGPHLGHFSRMLTEMKQVDSLSVLQVKGKEELVDALKQLLSRAELLEARQKSAKLAFSTVSNGVVKNVWKLVNNHCLGGRQAIGLNLKP
ncbi:probable 3-deoxy-D-manno-octulosonic acid transferase, mitochondrial isoform X3 [Phalaenopsis equestris]|uniref:probable 3-deoxy-D-manno-octulosonic acid transferase, mitochondrial isoform X3 n=1 Tax=Phalaenopsis equestris TaxID=78828 RepID=UPI0009E36AC2|nr:probable 3-deoxy-D-manno-octulosonic acid transferase, mitochondrial isoform X3 [Phalaenopsis equestris]